MEKGRSKVEGDLANANKYAGIHHVGGCAMVGGGYSHNALKSEGQNPYHFTVRFNVTFPVSARLALNEILKRQASC